MSYDILIVSGIQIFASRSSMLKYQVIGAEPGRRPLLRFFLRSSLLTTATSTSRNATPFPFVKASL